MTFRASPHEVVFFAGSRVHLRTVAPLKFISNCPVSVQRKMLEILNEIAKAPPWRFSGGGYWEAMHGEFAGWFELRVDGPGREHFRLFCQLDYFAEGFEHPLLVVICGFRKPFGTTLRKSDYDQVLDLGYEYWASNPRALA